MEASRGKITARSDWRIRKVVDYENEAAVLRYADCGKHFRIFFSIGRVEKV
jgi:hypothetical protein